MIHLELFNAWLSVSEAEDAEDGCILEWKSLQQGRYCYIDLSCSISINTEL